MGPWGNLVESRGDLKRPYVYLQILIAKKRINMLYNLQAPPTDT